MHHELLGGLCARLLLSHSKVTLPGLGCLLTQDQAAYFTRDGHILMPPGRRVTFRATGQEDPELLARTLAAERNIPLPEAQALITEALDRLTACLAKSKNEALGTLGRLRRTQEGQVFFVAAKEPGLDAEGFGLVPLAVSPVGDEPATDEPAEAPPAQANVGIQEEEEEEEEKEKEKEEGGKAVEAVDEWLDFEDYEAWERRKRRQRLQLVLAVILLALLIVLACGYLFRQELRPLYERLLYNAADREFLRSLPSY